MNYKELMAGAFSFIAVVISLVVLLSVSTDARVEAVVVVLLWAVSIGLVGRAILIRPKSGLLWLLVPLIFYAQFSGIRRIFGEVDMFAFVFHMSHGITFESLKSFEPEISTTFLSCLFLLISVWMLGNMFRAFNRLLPVLGVCLLLLNPYLHYIGGNLLNAETRPTLQAQLTEPTRVVQTKTDHPDLVLIYLEGLEQGFEEIETFGSAYGPIEDLRKQGISFRAVSQIEATGWTVAGMVASQCGVPLMPNGFFSGNLHGQDGSFLNKTICLGDILSTAGYRSEMVLGNNPSFGGINRFFKKHQFHEIHGEREIRGHYQHLDIKDRVWPDGLEDDLVADYLVDRFDVLAKSSQPIAMVTHFNGPHGISSAISKSCSKNSRAALTKSVPDAVKCTANSARRVVREILASHPDRDIVFVMMSDHLAHDAPGLERLKRGPRYNTVVAIGKGILPGSVSEKPGSMLDVFPTILNLLGMGLVGDQGGLGVSLLSDRPTLVDQFGLDNLDEIIRLDVDLANSIW